MKRYDSIGHILETDSQVVTDLVIPAGKKIPEHSVDYTVVVVPVKGRVIFSGHDFETELAPGIFVRMLSDEKHRLRALRTANSSSSSQGLPNNDMDRTFVRSFLSNAEP